MTNSQDINKFIEENKNNFVNIKQLLEKTHFISDVKLQEVIIAILESLPKVTIEKK